jgi:spore coat protein CotF
MTMSFTTKEKQLLEDQKNHEEICIKKYSDYAKLATDPQLSQLFTTHAQMEQEHYNTITQLLNGQVPVGATQCGGQGGQSTGSFLSQGKSETVSKSDKDLCTDILMTEKYISGAYNTAIFEFRDPKVRDVLNHIQKEEQKHGEAVFQYMQSKGMYSAQ